MPDIDSIETFLHHAYGCYFAEPRGNWVFRGPSDINYELIPSRAEVGTRQRHARKYERSLFNTVDGLAARIRWQHLITSPFNEREETTAAAAVGDS